MSCVRALWYALQAQQASNKARQHYYYSSYTQVVDKSVDNFVVIGWLGFGLWIEKSKTRVRALPKNKNSYFCYIISCINL